MGPRQGQEAAGALIAIALAAGVAAADPIITLPASERGQLAADAEGRTTLDLLVDVAGLGIVRAEPLTTWPDAGDLDAGEPVLVFARVGLVAGDAERHWVGVLRLDLAGATRMSWGAAGDRPGATASRLIDEAAVWWRPRVWAELGAGRWKVPFSRFRELDEPLSTSAAVPFSVERRAVDRRWGIMGHGDLGALSYAGGLYEDLDALEPRTVRGDPSLGGLLLAAARLEWTPRAPIGRDHLATTPDDPWYDTVKVSAGAGALVRIRSGDRRTDLSLGGQLQWRRFATVIELIVSQDDDLTASAAAETSAFVSTRLAAFARGDIDGELDLWSAGAGAAWMVTADRRNKLGVHGWLRRGLGEAAPRDGIIVLLQASL